MLPLSRILYREWGPGGWLAYFDPVFFRLMNAGVSANRFLGVHQRASGLGFEIVFLASMLIPAISIFTVLRLAAKTAAVGWVLRSVAGFAAVFLVPMGWFCAFQATWYGGEFLPFWRSQGAAVAEIEISLVCAFFILGRHWSLPMWCRVVGLLFHCGWWTRFMWPPPQMPLWSPRLFFFVFPCSAFSWLLYASTTEEGKRHSAVSTLQRN